MSFFFTGYPSSLIGAKAYAVPVRATTTANLVALSGLLTIDAVTLVAGDRVLVKDQSGGFGELNGIYVVAAGAWSRAADMNESSELVPGMLIPSSEGTVNGNKIFQLQTDDPIVLGTTDLTFAMIEAFDHGLLLGLGDDDHTQYLKVIGRTNEDQELNGNLKFSTGGSREIGNGSEATLIVQDLTYEATGAFKAFLGNDLTVGYTGGATAGAEVVSLVGNAIGVQISNSNVDASLVEQDLTYTGTGLGSAGNAITIEYVGDGVSGSETVDVTGTDILVHMDGASSYASLIEQDLTFTADTIGSGGNAITIAYVDDGTAGSETVNVVANAITVHMNDDLVAASLIEQDLTFTADTSGTGGNSITLEYTGGGTAGAEVVTVVANAISVQIGEDAAAVAASLVVDQLTYTADVAGVGGNSIQIEYLDTGTAGSEVSTTVGNLISVSMEAGVSTSNQIAAAIGADAAALLLINLTGSGSNTQSAMVATNLTGGTDAVVGSTATQIKTALDGNVAAAALVDTVVSGTGSDVQIPFGPSSLAGGLTPSTATQIKTAIDNSVPAAALVDVVISGTGGDYQTAISATNLAGGTTASTATQIKAAVDGTPAAAALVDVVISGVGGNGQVVFGPTNLSGGLSPSTATQVKAAVDAAIPTVVSVAVSGTGSNFQVPAAPASLSGGSLGDFYPGTIYAFDIFCERFGVRDIFDDVGKRVADFDSVRKLYGTAGSEVFDFASASTTNAFVIGKVLTGFVSGAGVVAATDSILQAFNKIDANANAAASVAAAALPSASFTDAAVTGKLITGYSSGAGVVAATDTILQAINKLNGNDAAKLPLAGGTLSGGLKTAGLSLAVVTTAISYLALATDDVIRCSAALTVTLPAATGSGKIYQIKNIGAGAVVIDANGSEVIDAATTFTLSNQYDSLTIVDGASGVWDIL